MITRIFNFLTLLVLCSTIGNASNNPVAETFTITMNAAGETIETAERTSWTNGDINQFYLDNTHTQKTFNDIRLLPGRYSWTLRTIKRNNKPGKVNLDISVKYQNGSKSKKVDRKLSPDRTDRGSFTLEDFKSQSSGTQAGYGMVKVHIGRAAHNTNVRYKITLTRTGGTTTTSSGTTGISGTSGTSGTSTSNCNYTSLGTKSGNVLGNTVGKYTSSKKACKNSAKVKVNKTGGRARTTILVYVSSSRNGTGTLKQSYEFPNGTRKSSKTINVSGCNGKFIRVEVKNRSAANTFKYNLSITQ